MEMGTSFSNLIHYFCEKLTFMCKLIISFIVQTKVTNRINWSEISDLYYYEPGGTSTKNVIHWIQLYSEQKYCEYDYGKKENMNIYGQSYPPQYITHNWAEWNIKSMLTTSDSDPFSDDADTNFFVNKVNNKNNLIFKNLTNYNHVDYLWSKEAKQDIFYDVVNFLLDK